MKEVMRSLRNGVIVGVTLLAIAYVIYVLCCGFNFPFVRIELLRVSAAWLSIVFICNISSRKGA